MVKKTVLILITFSIVLAACKNNGKDNGKVYDFSDTTELVAQKLKEVYYSLPSPMEIGSLFKQADMKFNSSVLHNPGDYVKYNSELALALNMGIYIADLSFASLFDQQQYTIKYFETTKKMASELNILGIVNDSVLNVLENNLNNPDKLQKTITETIFKSDAYLQQANRHATASLIIAGGWIETMYLVLSFINNEQDYTADIFCHVADQRLVLDNLISMLEAQDFPKKDTILNQLKDLQKDFDNMVRISKKQVYDSMSDTMRTKTIVEYEIDKDKVNKLLTDLTKIRTQYINMN